MMELDHGTLEMLKGGGLFAIVAYLLVTDRMARKEDREADLKRSEATSLMAGALKSWVDMLNRDKK